MFDARSLKKGDRVLIQFEATVDEVFATVPSVRIVVDGPNGRAILVRDEYIADMLPAPLPTKTGAVIGNGTTVAVLLRNGYWSGNFGPDRKPEQMAGYMGRFEVLREEA